MKVIRYVLENRTDGTKEEFATSGAVRRAINNMPVHTRWEVLEIVKANVWRDKGILQISHKLVAGRKEVELDSRLYDRIIEDMMEFRTAQEKLEKLLMEAEK